MVKVYIYKIYMYIFTMNLKTNTMKTKRVYIVHNEYSHALPSLSGENGLTFSFDLDKLNEELKNKIFGIIGIVSLSIDECKEIHAAKYRYKDDLSKFSINNIFNNEKAN